MIESHNDLSVRRQCELLNLARSGIYWEPMPMAEEDLAICKELDKLHLELPAFGSRKLSRLLKAQGQTVNRKRVQRLMRIMGIEALAPKPRTTVPAPEHTKFPYLLRHLAIIRPNQVWASDITYIPTRQGHCYLVAVMDWYTRRVLSWRISNTMDSRFCIEVVEEALANFGLPEIFNTDQGSQFTDDNFTSVLLDKGVKVSMDGRGRFMDNIFVRASMAVCQMRGGLLERLPRRGRRPQWHRDLPGQVQPQAASPNPWISDTRSVLRIRTKEVGDERGRLNRRCIMLMARCPQLQRVHLLLWGRARIASVDSSHQHASALNNFLAGEAHPDLQTNPRGLSLSSGHFWSYQRGPLQTI